MKYKVLYTSQSLKGLKRTSVEMRKRLKSRINEPCEDPYLGCRLTNSVDYRDKVGLYRIIYNINKKDRQITIHRAESRGKVYKRRDARR